MAKKKEEAEWRELVRQQAASGLGVEDFCRAHGVTSARFYEWRRRFGKGFAEVCVAPERRYRIELGGGMQIVVDGGFDAGEVKRLLEALC